MLLELHVEIKETNLGAGKDPGYTHKGRRILEYSKIHQASPYSLHLLFPLFATLYKGKCKCLKWKTLWTYISGTC